MSVKILVVEDNEQDQKIIKRFFAREGFNDVLFVDSGEDGVAKAKSEQPRIVITDTNLPGIDGFETCRQVKEARGDKTSVIVMTGAVDAVDAGRARQMGADDYCVKTSDCELILEALNNVIGKSNG